MAVRGLVDPPDLVPYFTVFNDVLVGSRFVSMGWLKADRPPS
jgi:hypothetical protein